MSQGRVTSPMSFSRLYLTLLVICLSIPIVAFQVAGTDIPLAGFAIFASIPLYFVVPNIREKIYFGAAVMLSIVSILFTSAIWAETIDLRPFVSMLYFFSPYLLFFAGYCLIKQDADMKFVLALFSFFFLLVSIAVTVSIIQAGGEVRVERALPLGEDSVVGSALAGSFFGLTLYATWGVISLAVFYATMLAVTFIHISYRDHARLPKPWYAIGVLCLLYLIIGSLSRTVLLGTVLFMFFSLLDLMRRSKTRFLLLSVSILAVIVVLISFSLYSDLQSSQFAWFSVIGRNVTALSQGNLDEFSSGRLALVGYAISDLVRNPVFGSGFHGFRLYASQWSTDDPAIGLNSSPHNQYLTAIWKMGLLPGVFYLLFLFRCVKNLYTLRRYHKQTTIYNGLWALMLAYMLGFCMFWDVLLVPLLGSFIMFILGGVARIYKSNTRQLSSRERTALAGREPLASYG